MLQVYSLTRVSTLLAVAVNMIGFDTTSPINCQVSLSPMSAFLYNALIGYIFQGLDHFWSGE